jgi:DNA-binding SARP family transcriptional activator
MKFVTNLRPVHKCCHQTLSIPEIMPELKIHLFGAFEVLIADQPIQHKYWQSRQVRTIFKLLILQRGRPFASTQFVEAIWPKEKQEVALQRLYIRISQLRRILELGAVDVKIQTIEGGYLFDYKYPQPGEISSCWIDVDVFENLADQGRMLLEQNQYQAAVEMFEKARSLYRADYLIEDQYDDWSMTERERLRDRFLILLTELSEAYAQMGQYRRAIHTCQKILQADSCREAVFVRLMLFYYYAGEKNKALQTFEHCQKVLWKELAV